METVAVRVVVFVVLRIGADKGVVYFQRGKPGSDDDDRLRDVDR